MTFCYPELKDNVALVTGASRGFGKAIAKRLAAEGAKVVVNFRRSQTEALQVVEEIEAEGGTAIAIRADMGDEAKINHLIETIADKFGQLDIVISNASFGIPGHLMSATSRYWDITMSSTARSLMTLAQKSVPLMKKRGRIVSVTSYGGQRVLDGYGVVGPAKAAVEGLTRTLAVELAPKGILVNGVMPGLSDTKSFRAIPGAVDILGQEALRTPIGRLVGAGEVANVVAFLCSDQAAMICGQFIIVDGGRFIVG